MTEEAVAVSIVLAVQAVVWFGIGLYAGMALA